MRTVFVTHFDSNYILQGVSLIDSLLNLYPENKIYVSPLDNLSEKVLKEYYQNHNNVSFDSGSIRQILEKRLRNNGKRSEIIFALKPLLIHAAMKTIDAERYFYCDADLYFFNKYIFDLGTEDIFLTEHFFCNALMSHQVYGKYNGGLIGFSRTAKAMECLNWWTERCEESTENTPKKGIVGDQKYLESFPSLAETLKSIKSTSLNQSVWMFDDNSIVQPGPKINGEIVDCFHFHRTRVFRRGFKTGINQYGQFRARKEVFNYIYKPYLEKLAITRDILGLCTRANHRFSLRDFRKYEWFCR